MGNREGARRQLTALFVGQFIGRDLGGCPQEWRTEVPQLCTPPTDRDVDQVNTCRLTVVSALSYDHTNNARPYPSVWSNCPRTEPPRSDSSDEFPKAVTDEIIRNATVVVALKEDLALSQRRAPS